MATEITMPKLSDTMTEGRLISWKKSVGEKVERGDILAEVETDKANMELESFSSGILLETRVKPGDMAVVGTVIAIVGDSGEAPPPVQKTALPSAEAEKQQPAPAEQVPKGKEAAETEEIQESVKPAEQTSAVTATEEEKASPMVRRLAREKGIDLKRVKGSGPDGRILQEDLDGSFPKQVEVKIENGKKPTIEERELKLEPPKPVAEGEILALSRMRAAIARAVSRAWREIPHFTVTVSINMSEAEEVRRELKESGTVLSINDLIIKAAAMALVKFPQVNNSFAGDRIRVNGEINIGIAVGLEEGLVVPVIKGCRELPLKEIAARSRELVGRVKNGKISETELSGGTFTISNLGMLGVEEFMAVIQPPQGAILAVGGIRDEAVVKNGAIKTGRVMRVTISADHRLIDGAYAAQFLLELKRVLENPVSILM